TIVTNLTIATTNNFVANVGGKGTNNTFIFNTAAWGTNNYDQSFASAVLGGISNIVVDGNNYALIAGGATNVITGTFGTAFDSAIVGGEANKIGNTRTATILNGLRNQIGSAAENSFILGGSDNLLDSADGTGRPNFSGILAGSGNKILANENVSYFSSFIFGGSGNLISNQFGIAIGQNITLKHDHNFAWTDGGAAYTSITNNQFAVEATNGIYVNGPLWLNQYNTNGG